MQVWFCRSATTGSARSWARRRACRLLKSRVRNNDDVVKREDPYEGGRCIECPPEKGLLEEYCSEPQQGLVDEADEGRSREGVAKGRCNGRVSFQQEAVLRVPRRGLAGQVPLLQALPLLRGLAQALLPRVQRLAQVRDLGRELLGPRLLRRRLPGALRLRQGLREAHPLQLRRLQPLLLLLGPFLPGAALAPQRLGLRKGVV
mmetsp:Transcript_48741/g.150883  ORF Transcript_48741/g.150883 Transcript_48741/m.150883 type:complete len:203 (+) Transcript_48741:380-988(+)